VSEPNDYENNIFGHGFDRCPETGRPYECGSGVLSKEEQTRNFIRERDRDQRQAASGAPAPPAPSAELPAPITPPASESKNAATLH
jgi:hypothetical protein